MKLLSIGSLLIAAPSLVLGAFPTLPQTCGWVFGDPHLDTFDNLKYDCQSGKNGKGEYVLSKSLNSTFEAQVRYYHSDDWGNDGYGTCTVGAVIQTGDPIEPVVEASFPDEGKAGNNLNECAKLAEYYIGGIKYTEDDLLGKTNRAVPDTLKFYFVDGYNRYFYFPKSDISYHVIINWHPSFKCFMGVKLCIPDKLKNTEHIVGQLGTPDGNKNNDFMARDGTEFDYLEWTKPGVDYFKKVHDYCSTTWCVWNAQKSLFQTHLSDHEWHECEAPPYDGTIERALATTDAALKKLCGNNQACLVDGSIGGHDAGQQALDQQKSLQGPEQITQLSTGGSATGDPHFKTWTGRKFEYHGECDLVLIHNPSFNDGQGLRVHIRTTRERSYSYIARVAIQIGTDVLEFYNDTKNYLLNGMPSGAPGDARATLLGGVFPLRQYKHALSVRLHDTVGSRSAKIDLHQRQSGFLGVVVDCGESDIFKGSLGLLGDWDSGEPRARDGKTVFQLEGTGEWGLWEAYAMEWQVRDKEPMLFHEPRAPQYPTKCYPRILSKRVADGRKLGETHFRKKAEKACDHWREDDREECIFDVMATQDLSVAEEGHIIHVE